MDDRNTNRYEAVKKLIDAAGGKLVSMYSYAAEGPGVLVIFDVPDPEAARERGLGRRFGMFCRD